MRSIMCRQGSSAFPLGPGASHAVRPLQAWPRQCANVGLIWDREGRHRAACTSLAVSRAREAPQSFGCSHPKFLVPWQVLTAQMGAVDSGQLYSGQWGLFFDLDQKKCLIEICSTQAKPPPPPSPTLSSSLVGKHSSWKAGAPWAGPEGWEPKPVKSGAPKVGPQRVRPRRVGAQTCKRWGPKGAGAQNFALFCPLPPQCSFFLLSLRGPCVDFFGVFEGPERTPKERRKNENFFLWRERGKKNENLGGPAEGESSNDVSTVQPTSQASLACVAQRTHEPTSQDQNLQTVLTNCTFGCVKVCNRLVCLNISSGCTSETN